MAAVAAPAALLTGGTEERGWRRGQHLIDALAYVDPLSPEEKAAAAALVAEEMGRSERSAADYLAELPPEPTLSFEGHPILAAELRRCERGVKMEPLDQTRTLLEGPPANRANDLTAWRAALQSAHSQLEHQHTRLLNLELLLQYGPKAWQAHNGALEAAGKRLQAEAAELKQQAEGVNRARKLSQTAGAAEAAAVGEQYAAALARVQEVAAAVRTLEAEVASLRDQAPQREEAAERDLFGIREGGEEADMEAADEEAT